MWVKTERERMTDGEKEILTYVAGTSTNSLSASLLDTQTHSQSNPRLREAVLHTADLLLKESSRENTTFSVTSSWSPEGKTAHEPIRRYGLSSQLSALSGSQAYVREFPWSRAHAGRSGFEEHKLMTCRDQNCV